MFLKGQLARLERALAQFMLDIHTEEFGYTEVVPPMLVRDAAAYGTANLPKFEDDLFRRPRACIAAQIGSRLHECGDATCKRHAEPMSTEMQSRREVSVTHDRGASVE